VAIQMVDVRRMDLQKVLVASWQALRQPILKSNLQEAALQEPIPVAAAAAPHALLAPLLQGMRKTVHVPDETGNVASCVCACGCQERRCVHFFRCGKVCVMVNPAWVLVNSWRHCATFSH